MHQICYGFYWGIKILSKLGERNWFFCSLWEVFCLPSNTPYESLARFCKMKYIFVVNFISIAFVVVKLKIFKFFYTTTSESMKGRLLGGGRGWGSGGGWGPFSPKYSSILLKFWPEVVSNKINTVWTIIQNFAYFGSNGTRLKFTVLFTFGAQFTAGKPKILLKTKIFAKTKSLGISNNVSPRSQKNYRILVKLSKKYFLGGQIGSKSPSRVTPKGDQKFSQSL